MNTTVAVYDTKPYDRESLARNGAETIDWRFLDFRLGPETAHAADGARAVCVFVNRGQLIDTAALIQGLKSRRLGGVALDVYEEEEGVFFEDLSGQVLEDDVLARLLTFPNVLITAHQAFLTREALQDIARVTVDNVRRLAAGQPFLEGTPL